MLLMHGAEDWLDHIDLWTEAEARHLLEAVLGAGPVGGFDCAASADGRRWFVTADHAEAVLTLSDSGRLFFAAQVRQRFGLDTGQPASAWWALPGGGTSAEGVASDGHGLH